MKDSISLSSISTQHKQTLLPALPSVAVDHLDVSRAREILETLRERREILTNALLTRSRSDVVTSDANSGLQFGKNNNLSHHRKTYSPTSIIQGVEPEYEKPFATTRATASHDPATPSIAINVEGAAEDTTMGKEAVSLSTEELILSLKQKRQRMNELLRRVEKSIDCHKSIVIKDLPTPPSVTKSHYFPIQEEKKEDFDVASGKPKKSQEQQEQQQQQHQSSTKKFQPTANSNDRDYFCDSDCSSSSSGIPKELHCAHHQLNESALPKNPLNSVVNTIDTFRERSRGTSTAASALTSNIRLHESSCKKDVQCTHNRNCIQQLPAHLQPTSDDSPTPSPWQYFQEVKDKEAGKASFSQLDASTLKNSLRQGCSNSIYIQPNSSYISTSSSCASSTSSGWCSTEGSSSWNESEDTITTRGEDSNENDHKIFQICHDTDNLLGSSDSSSSSYFDFVNDPNHQKQKPINQTQYDSTSYETDSSDASWYGEPPVNVVSTSTTTDDDQSQSSNFENHQGISITDDHSPQSDRFSLLGSSSLAYSCDNTKQVDPSVSPSSSLSYVYRSSRLDESSEVYATDSSGSTWYTDSPAIGSGESDLLSSSYSLDSSLEKSDKNEFDPYTPQQYEMPSVILAGQLQAIPECVTPVGQDEKCYADISQLSCGSSWDRCEKRSPQKVQRMPSQSLHKQKQSKPRNTLHHHSNIKNTISSPQINSESLLVSEPRALYGNTEQRAMIGSNIGDISALSMSSAVSMATFSVLAGGMYHIAKLSGLSKDRLYSTIEPYNVMNKKIKKSSEDKNKIRSLEVEKNADINNDLGDREKVAGGLFHLACQSGLKFESFGVDSILDSKDVTSDVKKNEEELRIDPNNKVRIDQGEDVGQRELMSSLLTAKMVRSSASDGGNGPEVIPDSSPLYCEEDSVDGEDDFYPIKATGGLFHLAALSSMEKSTVAINAPTRQQNSFQRKILLPESIADSFCASSGSLYDVATRSGMVLKNVESGESPILQTRLEI